MREFPHVIAFLIFAFWSCTAAANSHVEAVRGIVKSGTSATSQSQVRVGQKIVAGSTIVTGSKSGVTVRFDDGQVLVLDENSEFTIVEYAFSVDQPKGDKFVFELRKGAARTLSGKYTGRTRSAYVLRAEHATLAMQGTDFMVALQGGLYISVLKGSVSVKNSAGAAAFGHGMYVAVPSHEKLATAIAAGSFPASVLAEFNRLKSASVSDFRGSSIQSSRAISWRDHA